MFKSKASLGKRCDASLAIVADSINATSIVSTAVQSAESYQTTSTGWKVGPASILGSSTALSSSTTYGTYSVCGGWTSNASSHTISSTDFCLNTSISNSCAHLLFTVRTKRTAMGPSSGSSKDTIYVLLWRM